VADKDSPLGVGPARVAEIVSSYVRHHQIAPDQLAGLIVEVHRALVSLGRATRGARGGADTGGADPTLGTAGLCGLSRVRVSCSGAPPASAGRARSRRRRLSQPLELADSLSIDRVRLFGAALALRQGDRPRAPRHCGTKPDGNSATRHPATRSAAEISSSYLNTQNFWAPSGKGMSENHWRLSSLRPRPVLSAAILFGSPRR
jgi:hypothetical protein